MILVPLPFSHTQIVEPNKYCLFIHTSIYPAFIKPYPGVHSLANPSFQPPIVPSIYSPTHIHPSNFPSIHTPFVLSVSHTFIVIIFYFFLSTEIALPIASEASSTDDTALVSENNQQGYVPSPSPEVQIQTPAEVRFFKGNPDSPKKENEDKTQ